MTPQPFDKLQLYALRASAAAVPFIANRPLPSLSHYTDAAGLIGILKAREMWATDALFMNDASEVRWAYDLFRQRAPAWITEALRDHRDVSADSKETLIDRILATFDDSFKGVGENIYAVCFCENGDLLSQWRGYASFGGGYSIQFSPTGLQHLVGRVPRFKFLKVMYSDDDVSKHGRSVVTEVIDTVPDAIAKDGLSAVQISDPIARAIGAGLAQLVLRIKNPAFREEHEWRLVYSDGADVFRTTPLEREFRATARGVTPYVVIRTDEPEVELKVTKSLSLSSAVSLPDLPVASVTIGPTADPETSDRSIRYLLDDCGFEDVPILRSNIPLRR